MAEVQIVFGSNGGNTKMVCEYVGSILSEAGHEVKIDRCEHFPETNLTGHGLLILACSTYEHGQLEDHFKLSFWPRIQDVDLAGQKCVVIGLGDSKYDTDYNIESGRILERYVKTHNGELIQENLMINKSPLPQLETLVKNWALKLSTKLLPETNRVF
jgi:flavodoxin